MVPGSRPGQTGPYICAIVPNWTLFHVCFCLCLKRIPCTRWENIHSIEHHCTRRCGCFYVSLEVNHWEPATGQGMVSGRIMAWASLSLQQEYYRDLFSTLLGAWGTHGFRIRRSLERLLMLISFIFRGGNWDSARLWLAQMTLPEGGSPRTFSKPCSLEACAFFFFFL